MGELILTIPSKHITEEGLFKMSLTELERLVKKHGAFLDRDFIETNPKYKQLIPYVVLKDGEHYVVYQRTVNQTEKRLHNKYSLGVGGHINIGDKSPSVLGTIFTGMLRELSEEFNVILNNFEYLGVLNYNETDVSKVHLGIVFLADVDYMGVNEIDNFEVYFTKNLEDYFEQFEDWSKIIAEYLLNLKQF